MRRPRTLLIALITAQSLGLVSACRSTDRTPVATHEPTAERLRFRAELAARYFIGGDFKRVQALGSERHRREIESLSSADQKRSQQDLEMFARREQPTSEILTLEMQGNRARVTKRISVLKQNGTRSYGLIYDHWVFENGDWFFDEPDRIE